jgi:Undecaprenyl-phosphate glucose phosphotransferase
MSEMQTNRYNDAVVFLVKLGDFILYNLIFYLFCQTGQTAVDPSVSTWALQLIISFSYLLAASRNSVILHLRKVYAYQVVMKVFRNTVYFAIISGLAFAVLKYVEVDSYFYLAYLCLCFLTVSAYRLVFSSLVKSYRRRGGNLRHVVLVGSTPSNLDLYHEMMDDASTGYRVCGYFDFEANPSYPAECPYLGTPDQVTAYLKAHPHIQYLFCGLPSQYRDVIIPIIDFCENHLVHFNSVPNLHNYLQNRVYLNMLGDVPYLSLRRDPLSLMQNKLLKRAFDVVFSLLFLCTLFPIILVVVFVMTKLTMPGPLFFCQKRNGLNDKEFYVIKFRSMKVNKEADTLQATKDDPRKTRWGNIMRKTNLDEMPQFINVLLGDMSIVGPRPHMLKHTEEYSKLINKYMVRHFVKPGITGWSQVTGFRGETKELKDMEGRIRGDIWYIEHWSFWLDLFIIWKTVANVFHGEKNAY